MVEVGAAGGTEGERKALRQPSPAAPGSQSAQTAVCSPDDTPEAAQQAYTAALTSIKSKAPYLDPQSAAAEQYGQCRERLVCTGEDVPTNPRAL
jgi:hypothetical protein